MSMGSKSKKTSFLERFSFISSSTRLKVPTLQDNPLISFHNQSRIMGLAA